jgi:UDP-N-acetylmuramyl-tripeptide synthetase
MTPDGCILPQRQIPLHELLGGVVHIETMGSVPEGERVHAVTCDSRAVVKGALFVAIRGYSTDGHRFIESAVGHGAIAVICEEFPGHSVTGCLYIRVNDSRKSLAEVSRLFYGRASDILTLIGVTGTNGKTTTARLITAMLNANGVSAGYIGTNLCLIGGEEIALERTTPEADYLHALFARMLDAGCKAAVMEVSSHALMLGRVHGLSFRVAVFTNLTPEHLDFHESMQEYAAAKKRLFCQLATDGIAVFNIDDPYALEMMEGVEPGKRFCCSLKAPGPVVACSRSFCAEIRHASTGFSDVSVYFPGSDVDMQIPFPGAYNVMNVLEAVAAGFGLGLDPGALCRSLSAVSPIDGRMERIGDAATPFTIFVDYAHTPDALRKALGTLRELMPSGSRLFVVFGCGGDRDKKKRPEMGRIASETADMVILTSDNPRSEEPEVIIDDIEQGMSEGRHIRIGDRRAAIGTAIAMLNPGDILLVAGKGHEKYQEIKGRREYFSDQETIRTYLKTRGSS